MATRRQFLGNSLVIAGGAALAGCSSAAPTPRSTPVRSAAAPTTQAPRRIDTVNVASFPTAAQAPLYLAIDKGYLADRNVELNTVPVKDSSEPIPLLGTGQLDVLIGAVTAGLLNAVARSVHLRLVAPMALMPRQGPSFNQLVIRKALWDSGEVRSVGQLRDRQVGLIARGATAELILYKLLRAHGLDLEDLNEVELPYPDQMTALASGAVAAALTSEPFVTQMVDRGLGVTLPDRTIAQSALSLT